MRARIKRKALKRVSRKPAPVEKKVLFGANLPVRSIKRVEKKMAEQGIKSNSVLLRALIGCWLDGTISIKRTSSFEEAIPDRRRKDA